MLTSVTSPRVGSIRAGNQFDIASVALEAASESILADISSIATRATSYFLNKIVQATGLSAPVDCGCEITSGFTPPNRPRHYGVDVVSAQGKTNVDSMTAGQVYAQGVASDGTHYLTVQTTSFLYSSDHPFITYLHTSSTVGNRSQVNAGAKIGTMVWDPEPGFNGLHVHVFGTNDGSYTAATLTSRQNVTDLLSLAGCVNKP